MRTRLIQTFISPQGIAPLLPPKPEAAPLSDGAADGAVENGDATNNAHIAERRRAAEMVALVRVRISGWLCLVLCPEAPPCQAHNMMHCCC